MCARPCASVVQKGASLERGMSRRGRVWQLKPRKVSTAVLPKSTPSSSHVLSAPLWAPVGSHAPHSTEVRLRLGLSHPTAAGFLPSLPVLGREKAELLSMALAAAATLPVLHPDWR